MSAPISTARAEELAKRLDNGWRYLDEPEIAAALRSLARERDELQAEVDRLRGHHADGPYRQCTDCGRFMVWDDGLRESPVWMCPACVMRRRDAAEAALAAERQRAERLSAALRGMLAGHPSFPDPGVLGHLGIAFGYCKVCVADIRQAQAALADEREEEK